MMREIAPGEHYHIFNRGVLKQNIFHNRSDFTRFLFLILYFQSPKVFQNIGRPTKAFVKHSMFNIHREEEQKVIAHRSVELVAFCLMPNHFHLILKEIDEGGIAKYMQRILNSYTKYINTKYKKSGHLFQGSYRSVHIADDRQLLYLSAYIHRNPRELREWIGKESGYIWSSYQDFVHKNRWNELLVQEIILGQFKNQKEYQKFMDTSTSKLLEDEIEEIQLE